MLKNREFYFADPKHLNDPVDCQIGIYSALVVAIDKAEKELPTVKQKLQKLGDLNKIFQSIENDVKQSAIFSLSKKNNNILMWSHYADNHKGFAAGFQLSTNFTEYNPNNAILGTNKVKYFKDNPFVDFFLEYTKSRQNLTMREFAVRLISMGLAAKSKPWENEKEVRIVRGKPGKVHYSPDELKEIIFGLKMDKKKRQKIRKTLSGSEWSHVKMHEIIRKNDGFKMKIVPC